MFLPRLPSIFYVVVFLFLLFFKKIFLVGGIFHKILPERIAAIERRTCPLRMYTIASIDISYPKPCDQRGSNLGNATIPEKGTRCCFSGVSPPKYSRLGGTSPPSTRNASWHPQKGPCGKSMPNGWPECYCARENSEGYTALN